MRLHPRNLVLLVLVVGLAAAKVALDEPLTTASSSGPLVAGADLLETRTARVRIEDPAGGEAVTLVRDGATWRVEERWNHPAEPTAVAELLARVAALNLADRVANEAANHGRFGVGEDALRIRLQDGAGRSLADLRQGRPAEGGDAGVGSYVRLASGDDVLRAHRFEPVSPAPRAWLDTRLLRFDPAVATQLSVHHEGGRIFFDLMRTPDGWRDVAREGTPEVSRLAVERLLTVASTLYFEDVAGTELRVEDGFGAPPETLIEVAVGTEEEPRIVSLWIGVPTGDGFTLATNPARAEGAAEGPATPWIVRLPSESARVLFGAIEALAP